MVFRGINCAICFCFSVFRRLICVHVNVFVYTYDVCSCVQVLYGSDKKVTPQHLSPTVELLQQDAGMINFLRIDYMEECGTQGFQVQFTTL